MEQSVEFNSYEEFKTLLPYFGHISDLFFFKKKHLSENPVNLDMGI